MFDNEPSENQVKETNEHAKHLEDL